MNVSFNDTDYKDEDCEKGDVVKLGSIAVPVFFSIVIALSLTGNILVLVILALYENLKSLSNISILNLAISDLVFTTGLPFRAVYHIWAWSFSETICKAVTFVFFSCFCRSILFLTTMTTHRYLAVVHLLPDQSTQRIRPRGFVSVPMWIVSIGAAIPSLLYSSLVQIPHKDEHSWGCEYKSTLWKTICICQQNIVLAFCYIQILGRIRGTSHTKNRAVKSVFCIVAVLYLSWVPYNVVILRFHL